MKNYLIIAIGVVIIVGIAGLFFLQLLSQNNTPVSPGGGSSSINTNPGSTSVTPSPTSGNQTGTDILPQGAITISGSDGRALQVNNFKNDPTVTSDTADHYYLAGASNAINQDYPFTIVYITTDQSFTIGLWEEPLRETRLQAEQVLLQKLGISKQVACTLRYWVSTPRSVNEIYTGKNLGFSFCPGAVAL